MSNVPLQNEQTCLGKGEWKKGGKTNHFEHLHAFKTTKPLGVLTDDWFWKDI